MLKVFLAGQDKEPAFDWKARGYEMCGEAADGEIAIPMISSLSPDIVIADVDMPYVNGLELGSIIKRNMPDIKVIILTDNTGFECARKAVSLGFFDYLIRPVTEERLFEVVEQAAIEIESRRKEQELYDECIRRRKADVYNKKTELFKSIFTESKPVARIIEMAEELGIELSSRWYNASVIMFKYVGEAGEAVVESVSEWNGEPGWIIFDTGFNKKTVIFRADSMDELNDVQNDFFVRFRDFMKNNNSVTYYGGTGNAVGRISELPESLGKAGEALAHSLIIGDNLILNSEDAVRSIYLKREERSIRDIDAKEIDRTGIQEFLRFGNSEDTEDFVHNMLESFGVDALELNIFRQYVLVGIYFCVGDFLSGIRLDRNAIEAPDTATDTIRSREGVTKYVIKIIRHALKLREEASGGRYSDIVNEAMRYIEKNYADEKLSLNLLASHVNFSPNHLSMIFSQQTGHTFIKYLTDFRMNKAKELLLYTTKRSSEISMEVGYKDPHYFSYLFKKTQGMTPTQYRGSGNTVPKSGE